MAGGKAVEVRGRGSRRRAIGGKDWEIPVEMIGLFWLGDSRLRMTQYARTVPTGLS
jgi:hypothetical protein